MRPHRNPTAAAEGSPESGPRSLTCRRQLKQQLAGCSAGKQCLHDAGSRESQAAFAGIFRRFATTWRVVVRSRQACEPCLSQLFPRTSLLIRSRVHSPRRSQDGSNSLWVEIPVSSAFLAPEDPALFNGRQREYSITIRPDARDRGSLPEKWEEMSFVRLPAARLTAQRNLYAGLWR